MAPRALAAAVLLALLGAPAAQATGRMAVRTGQSCIACHLDRHGKTGLNHRGSRLISGGLRPAFDAAHTVPGEGAPLSPGGAQMLERRYFDLGRRLFQLRDVGRRRVSCAACHAGGKDLEARLWERYPRFRPDLERWVSLEGAIAACMTRRQGAEPLAPLSRSAVALQVFLRKGFGMQPAGVGEAPPAAAAPPGGLPGPGELEGPGEGLEMGEMELGDEGLGGEDLGGDELGDAGLGDEDLDLGGLDGF